MHALVHEDGLRLDPKRPVPAAGRGEALLRVRQAGVCATDLEIVRGYMGFRGVLGHEFVADVVEGPEDLVGRRVVGEINCPCGKCELCRRGLSGHCPQRTVLGIAGRDGAFAEFVTLPAENLHAVPDAVDDDAAVFVEPLAAACQVLRQVAVDDQTWVTVLGDGRLGLLVAQVLADAGAPVRVLGRHPAKLALCERWGIQSRPVADVKGRADQDVVVDCTGSAAGLATALKLVRPRGTVVLKSTVAEPAAVDLSPAVVNEVTILGSRCGDFGAALGLLAAGRVDVAGLIHRRMKLAQGVEALTLAGRPGVLKVILTMT